MFFQRFSHALQVLWLSAQSWLWRRQEERALLRIGAAVAGQQPVARDEAVRDVVSRATHGDARLRILAGASVASLDTDRADYAVVSRPLLALVILRGALERIVLRERARLLRKTLAPARAELGAFAIEGRVTSSSPPASDEAAAVSALRGRLSAAQARIAELQRRHGGAVVPRWLSGAAREAARLAVLVVHEVRAKVLPKGPALAGMVVGWAIAHTYTDSHVDATLSRFGLKSGGTRVISRETLERMNFWLPLLAAVLCSYLGGRLSAALNARYALRPDALPAAQDPALRRDPAQASTVMVAPVEPPR